MRCNASENYLDQFVEIKESHVGENFICKRTIFLTVDTFVKTTDPKCFLYYRNFCDRKHNNSRKFYSNWMINNGTHTGRNKQTNIYLYKIYSISKLNKNVHITNTSISANIIIRKKK